MFVYVLLLLFSAQLASESYETVQVDQQGQLQIVTKDGKTITPRKARDQVGFDMPAISPDSKSVGWLALYPNASTSYPIPLELVIYTNGKARTYKGSGLPVWHWRFEAEGKQVAFEQETVHGGIGVHYELRDVASGRLIAEYNPASGSASRQPQWVVDLDSRK